jgi:hypothetical protein
MINRTKALVLALFAFYWAAVVAILVAARDVYHQILNQALQVGNLPISSQRPAELSVLLVLTALLLLLTAGVIRSWRWTFWLILIVFFAGILHVVTRRCAQRSSAKTACERESCDARGSSPEVRMVSGRARWSFDGYCCRCSGR